MIFQGLNSGYQRLNHVDLVVANRELSALVQSGLIKQHRTRRWAFYTLTVPVEVEVPKPAQTDEEKILDYVRKQGSINNSECCATLGIKPSRAWYLLKKMTKEGLLKSQSEKRWKRYMLP